MKTINTVIINQRFLISITIIIILYFEFVLKPPPLQHKIKLQDRITYGHFLTLLSIEFGRFNCIIGGQECPFYFA